MALIETDEGQLGQAWPKPPACGHARRKGTLCNDGAADLLASVIAETGPNRDRRAVFNAPACTGSGDGGPRLRRGESDSARDREDPRSQRPGREQVVAMTDGYEHVDRADRHSDRWRAMICHTSAAPDQRSPRLERRVPIWLLIGSGGIPAVTAWGISSSCGQTLSHRTSGCEPMLCSSCARATRGAGTNSHMGLVGQLRADPSPHVCQVAAHIDHEVVETGSIKRRRSSADNGVRRGGRDFVRR